jgi:hypothetical protein
MPNDERIRRRDIPGDKRLRGNGLEARKKISTTRLDLGRTKRVKYAPITPRDFSRRVIGPKVAITEYYGPWPIEKRVSIKIDASTMVGL